MGPRWTLAPGEKEKTKMTKNETLVRGIKVKTKVKAGVWPKLAGNKNETLVRQRRKRRARPSAK